MEDTDTKPSLPVHLILGAAEYSKIKTSEPQRTGSVGDPVAEYIRFGWTIMSPEVETNLDNMFLAQPSGIRKLYAKNSWNSSGVILNKDGMKVVSLGLP